METGWTRIERLTPADRESTAPALLRADYEARQIKEKCGRAAEIYPEYQR